jgi:hypothetical protein
MQKWPRDGSPVKFEELAKPVRAALDGGKYEGLDIGLNEKAGCPSPAWSLSPRGLRSHEEQGRDRTDVLLMTAVQLGIEQGRRLYRRDLERALAPMIKAQKKGIPYTLEDVLPILRLL